MSTATDLLHEADDPTEVAIAEPGAVVARSPLQLFFRRVLRDRVALIAAAFIVLLCLAAIFAGAVVDLFGTADPNVQDSNALDDIGLPSGPTSDFWPIWSVSLGEHPFGVDDLGRDVLSRVVYGAQVSLKVAFFGTGVSIVIGVTMGMIAGFYRGWVDATIARLIDLLLAFPVLLLGLGLATACAGKDGCLDGALQPGVDLPTVGGVWDLMVSFVTLEWVPLLRDNPHIDLPTVGIVIPIIVLANSPYVARIVRGQVLSLREREFIEASRALGASNMRIIFREILPNLVAPIIVYATLFIPANILLEAALSFLGVGVEAPTASWGAMLSKALGSFDTAWWFMLAPGCALLLTVLAFNLVGDGLQDALNPKGTK